MSVDHIAAIWFDYQIPIIILIGCMAFPIFTGMVGINVMRSRHLERYVVYLLLAQ